MAREPRQLDLIQKPFQVRLATLGDLCSLTTLSRVSLRELAVGHYTLRQVESGLTHLFGPDPRLIEDRTYYVAERGGRVIGGGGWTFRTPPFAAAPPAPVWRHAHLRGFFVHPDFARRGVGRMLLAMCEMAADRAGFASLGGVAPRTAVPFFTGCGFEITERSWVTLPDGVSVPMARVAKTQAAAAIRSLQLHTVP